MRWMQIAIRPAKPFASGRVDGTPVFGLPGNPVSSLVSFELLARPGAAPDDGAAGPRPPPRRRGRRRGLRRRPDGKMHFVRVARVVRRRPRAARRPGRRRRARHQLAAMARRQRAGRAARRRRRRPPATTSRCCCMASEVTLAGFRRSLGACPARRSTPSGASHRDLRISVTDRCNFRCTYCMPAEGMDWLPRERAAHLRGDRAGGPGLRRALRVRRRSASPAASRPCGPTSRCWSRSSPRLGVDLAMTTNGATLRPARPRPGRGRAAPHQHLARLAAHASGSWSSPGATTLDQVLDGIDAALDAGLRPVKVNVRARARRERRRGRRLRRLRPRAGRDGALHRVHAARRRRRLGRRQGRAAARDRRRHRRRVPARAVAARATSRPSASATSTAGARSA